jgi:hypothetical protein
MTRSEQFVDSSWQYERLEGPSHWIPLEVPGELSQLVLRHIGGIEKRQAQA